MKLIPAEGQILEQILDESHEIWSDGLTRTAYDRYNVAQVRTPWGSRNLRRLALVDERGRLLSSAKRYDLRAILDGCEISVLGIGAVFTPERGRGRGHARDLIELILSDASSRGADLALLFSEIDPSYYERMGFVAVPRHELAVRPKDAKGAPMVLARAAEERDIPAITDLVKSMARGHRFALVHDEAFVRYGVSKKRLLAGFLQPHTLSVEFHIVEEGAGAVAFAILTATADDVVLEMCGDRDPAGARVGALLQVLRARTPAERVPPVSCFLPPGWCPPQVEIVSRRLVREVMMVRPLKPGVLRTPLKEEDVLYWHGDLF
jgi:N-acetylglutamate synthase-like GNAT family acetyltransferase